MNSLAFKLHGAAAQALNFVITDNIPGAFDIQEIRHARHSLGRADVCVVVYIILMQFKEKNAAGAALSSHTPHTIRIFNARPY